MSHGDDLHDAFRVLNRVDDSVVADADAPAVLSADQFSATGRPRLAGQPPYS